MILKKDGKIVVNNGKILTNDGELNPSVATKVQEALSNSLDNKNAIEKIISGEIPIGSIISISVDGKEIKTDINGNVDLSITQYKGGSKINYSSETGKLSLLDSANNVISEVNLPLESFVKSGRYNSVTKEIELTLTSDEVIKIPVEKLIDVYKADEKDITLKSDNTFELTDNFKLRFNNKVDKNQLSDYALKTETVTQDELDTKQNKLNSGGNIKTINGLSLLGAGNLNFTDVEITDGSTITINLGSTNDAKWYRLAKLLVPEVNASGTFTVDYYEDESLVSSATFSVSVGLNEEGRIISEICPLIRVPNELQEASEGGSSNGLDAGLVSIRTEKSEDGIFIVGLINSINPTLEKKQNFNITIQNAINFKVSENLKTVVYKYDNEKIDLTDEVDISEDVNFNIKMEYKKYKSLLNKGMFEGYNIINGQKASRQNYVIFGFKSLNDGVKTWTFCDHECDGVPIRFGKSIHYEVTSETPTSGDLDWNINNEKIINKLGIGVHSLTITYDGASENLYHFRLNEKEINNKTTLEEEYGIYLNNLDEIYWDQGETEAIIITVTESIVNTDFEIKKLGNILDYINKNYVTQISPYAKIGFEQIYGDITITVEKGLGELYVNGTTVLTVSSGESKTVSVKLDSHNTYDLFATSMETVTAIFTPKVNTDDTNLQTIINFNFDNTFSLSGTSGNSEFINTFPSDILKTATYQYGIDAELNSYELYDLSKKIEELESKGNGEVVDNSITDLGTVTSLDDDILKSATTVGLYKFIWSPDNVTKYMCLMEVSKYISISQIILTCKDNKAMNNYPFIQYSRYYYNNVWSEWKKYDLTDYTKMSSIYEHMIDTTISTQRCYFSIINTSSSPFTNEDLVSYLNKWLNNCPEFSTTELYFKNGYIKNAYYGEKNLTLKVKNESIITIDSQEYTIENLISNTLDETSLNNATVINDTVVKL